MAFSLDTRTDLTAGWRRRGSLESFNQDGLELARRRRHERVWPLRQAGLFLLTVLSFKIFLYLDLGGAAYGAKVYDLRNGNAFERVVSHAMQLDPMSRWLVMGLQHGRW